MTLRGNAATGIINNGLSENEPSRRVQVLIVEDESPIAELFVNVLSAAEFDVRAVTTAEEAMAALSDASFDIAFFDINLPDANGLILLQQCLRIVPGLPVVMITGQADVEIARRAMQLGACDFVSKPFSIASLPIIVERNVTRTAMAQASEKTHQRELQNSYETVLDALLTALDTRDTETEGHSERVTGYTMLLAGQLGVSADEQYHIERGALLHDIGKIGVPDRILLKPGPLTDSEWTEMRKHPSIGHKMCSRIDFLKGASEIILHHHERWDGAGYPSRLKGEAIPLGARIFAVVDTFDAMTTDRPYRSALPYAAAAEEILKYKGTQFDPQIVEAFLVVPEARWNQVREMVGKG